MSTSALGPFQLGPRPGPNPRASTLLSELEMARLFTLSIVRGLSAEQLAASPIAGKNAIGSVLSHLTAAEGVMQRITTGGQPFPDEAEEDKRAFGFEGDPLVGQGLDAYLERLEARRARTREIFAERDDAWLDEPRSFLGNPGNHHYYWFHLLLDEARHQGQMILLRRYLLPDADLEFQPYVGLAAPKPG